MKENRNFATGSYTERLAPNRHCDYLRMPLKLFK